MDENSKILCVGMGIGMCLTSSLLFIYTLYYLLLNYNIYHVYLY